MDNESLGLTFLGKNGLGDFKKGISVFGWLIILKFILHQTNNRIRVVMVDIIFYFLSSIRLGTGRGATIIEIGIT